MQDAQLVFSRIPFYLCIQDCELVAVLPPPVDREKDKKADICQISTELVASWCEFRSKMKVLSTYNK